MPYRTYLVRKRPKRPILTKSCLRPGGAAPRHGVVIFWQCFFHDFLPNRVLKRRLFKIYFLGRKNGFGPPPSVVLSPKNHDFQLRTCFFAIFAARVLAGRAVVEKCPKRCLKRYPGGPVAVKTPYRTYLVRKRPKRPIWVCQGAAGVRAATPRRAGVSAHFFKNVQRAVVI